MHDSITPNERINASHIYNLIFNNLQIIYCENITNIHNKMLKKIIENKIKEKFETEKNFCEKQGYSQKDFSKKKRTAVNKLDWLKEFLNPMGIKIKIINNKKK